MTTKTSTAAVKLLAICLVGLGLFWPVQTQAASSQIQANVCPSAIVRLNVVPPNNSHLAVSHVSVDGYTTSGLSISVKANGKSYPPRVISTLNHFATIVPLQPGRNQITVTASNACGQSDKRLITVYRTRGLAALSPLTRTILWLILLIILILILLWLLIYKRRRQKKDEDGQNQNIIQPTV